MDRFRPSLRRHLRPWPARRPGPRRPVRLSAQRALDPHRRGPRRGGAGFHHSLLFAPPQWQIARTNGEGGTEQRRGIHCHGRDRVDHGHSPGGAGPRRRARPGRKPLGRLHGRHDHSHRHADGRISAILAHRQGPRRQRARRRAAPPGGLGWKTGSGRSNPGAYFYPEGASPGLDHHRLRPGGERAARLAPPGPARLLEHLHEAGHHLCPRPGHFPGPAQFENACDHPFHRWLGPGGGRQALPFLFHHHRVRSHLRIPYAHLERNHAEADHARNLCPLDRLWVDVPRIAGGDHGAHRRLHPRSRDLFQHEHQS